MSEENKKIVIVVGAGASADFHPKHFSFPVGEALIKNICNKEEVASFFWNEICESFRNVVSKKIDQAWINFHNIFCDFLTDSDVTKDIIKSNFLQITVKFSSYLRKNVDKLIKQINFNTDNASVGKILDELYININANDEDCFEDKKECKFYKIIIANCNSRHLQISRLVNYYQPFSIDELLDSIKTKKINVLEPLKIEEKDLKAILKSDEEDSKKLEEQFRNELINAGKTLIAMFLLRSEKRDLFDNPNPQNDAKIWYRHIRNLIINSGKNSEKIEEKIENITIISFNYDRSLDYYLRTRLKKYYDKIEKRIFYPYGKLAVDNWNCDDYGKHNKDGKFNPYNDDELREIVELGKGLRVIGELDEEVVIQEEFDEETGEKLQDFKKLKKEIELISQIPTNKHFTRNEIKEILKQHVDILEKICKYLQEKNEELSNENPKKKIIKHHQKDCEFLLKRVGGIYGLVQSDKIYFLGFAFHQDNCNLLGLNQLYKINYQGNIYYTNFDESESINKMVNEIFIIGKEPWKLTLHDSKRKGVYEALMHDFKLGF